MNSSTINSAFLPVIRLAVGREKMTKTFHPWVFSGALGNQTPVKTKLVPTTADWPQGTPLPGLVRVEDHKGGFLAWAQYHPGSKIALRLLEWQENSLPDCQWLANRLRDALSRRLVPVNADPADQSTQAFPTNAQRLVFSEADHLPGLIIEGLSDWLVVQSENRVIDAWMPLIADLLPDIARLFIPGLQGILERSDGDGRQMEGLPHQSRTLWGSVPNEAVPIRENGLEFWVDLHGQKAGFYTDQRENRALVARYAKDRRILDVCCYSGGFSAAALANGATSATLVDASAEALVLAKRNLVNRSGAVNATRPIEFIQGDAFKVLRQLQDQGQGGFDLIILDPPKLAPNRNSLERALAAYKDLNLQALKLLPKGGILASFSCSGLVTSDDLRQAIAWAAKDAGLQVQILHHFGQAPCHPVLLSFPEGQYLKGFLLRVV